MQLKPSSRGTCSSLSLFALPMTMNARATSRRKASAFGPANLGSADLPANGADEVAARDRLGVDPAEGGLLEVSLTASQVPQWRPR